ncbi:hypothetical protein ACFQGT_06460 [Natrialbaceae archaeon GCM10025810]|uniref:hypothetical protein n=1 Tax=Halovalidus salilacus TaxID=3075124 RepID=UPI003622A030
MGILETMLGRSSPSTVREDGRTYTLPRDIHGFAYPVAVPRVELEAFQELLEAEDEAPYLGEGETELREAVEDVLDDETFDADAWADRMREPRQRAQPVLETWLSQVEADDDIGVVYLPSDTYEVLASFVKVCRQRDELENDPFELPENTPRAVSLLKRLERASNDQYRVVVHTDLLPPKR